MKKIRIGCGAGFGGDRLDPAMQLVEKGNIDYLIYECMAERTIALYQQQKLKDSQLGYNPQIERRLKPIIQKCYEKGIKIITNMGAANPLAAVEKIYDMAVKMHLKKLKIACVQGDDVLEILKNYASNKILETHEYVKDYLDTAISANAYLGIDGIVEGLNQGADIIITGRVADPSLFLAPMLYELHWDKEDYDLLGKGSILGHLMECAGQVTGGYFADPGYKDVSELWNLGFPIVEVGEDGNGYITKVEDTGGIVNEHTCKEQLLYEVHNPASYITPDCIVDFTSVELFEIGKDQVKVVGGLGRSKPKDYKVSIGYKDGYIGIGEISYGGIGAVDRGLLAKKILEKRFDDIDVKYEEIKYDFIGIDSLYNGCVKEKRIIPYEVRLQVKARCADYDEAIKIGEEVEALWTNGPYGGGGAKKEVKEVIGIVSTLIPREKVDTHVYIREVI